MFFQVLITEDFLQRLDKDVDDLTRPNEVNIVIYSSISYKLIIGKGQVGSLVKPKFFHFLFQQLSLFIQLRGSYPLLYICKIFVAFSCQGFTIRNKLAQMTYDLGGYRW